MSAIQKLFDFVSGKIHIAWTGEFMHNLWTAEKTSFVSSLESSAASTATTTATNVATTAANAAATQIVNAALTQVNIIYVGTEHNCELLRKFGIEGQTVVLGGSSATQFVEGDSSTVTDQVPQWDSTNNVMITAPMTIVYHPYVTYYGGNDDGLGWVTVDSIGTDNCSVTNNTLTLNSVTGIYPYMYVQLTVTENSNNVIKRYQITNITGNDLILSATPTNVVSGSDVKIFK